MLIIDYFSLPHLATYAWLVRHLLLLLGSLLFGPTNSSTRPRSLLPRLGPCTSSLACSSLLESCTDALELLTWCMLSLDMDMDDDDAVVVQDSSTSSACHAEVVWSHGNNGASLCTASITTLPSLEAEGRCA
jgi:hypothetical protein